MTICLQIFLYELEEILTHIFYPVEYSTLSYLLLNWLSPDTLHTSTHFSLSILLVCAQETK